MIKDKTVNDWNNFTIALVDAHKKALTDSGAIMEMSQLLLCKARLLGKQQSMMQLLHLKWYPILVTNSETKAKFWKQLSKLRTTLQDLFEQKKVNIIACLAKTNAKRESIDLSENQYNPQIKGSLHPFTTEYHRILNYFQQRNFIIREGHEVDFVNNVFTLLNISNEHVSNDRRDTFFIKNNNGYLLRTHCTNGTSYFLSNHYADGEGQFNFLTVGKVFRRDTHDATHLSEFNQLDACMVGPQWNILTLKLFIDDFLTFFFATIIKSRWRVSYFPFTSPSFEIDISCPKCRKSACQLCHDTKWIEVLGAGIVHSRVIQLTNAKIAQENLVVAFGLGIERIIMLKQKIFDIRTFYENDVRLLVQLNNE